MSTNREGLGWGDTNFDSILYEKKEADFACVKVKSEVEVFIWNILPR